MNVGGTVGGFSNWGKGALAMRVAMRPGLVAAGNVVRNAVRRNLRGGYISSLGNHGDFTTGTSLNHVTLSDPVIRMGSSGVDSAYISVGTDLLYNLYWEVGHHNLYTRHFERDERWRPAMLESRAAALAAFNRVFQRALQSAGG